MQISRRDALMGASAAAVVAGAITAPLAIKAALAETADPVIGLSVQLCDVWKAWMSAQEAIEETLVQVHKDIGGRIIFEMAEAILIAGQSAADPPVAPFLFDGRKSLRQEEQHWKARFWELQARLLDTPATTTRGVLAKLRGFYGDREIATIRTGFDDLPGEYAASIYRDLERLAGEVRS